MLKIGICPVYHDGDKSLDLYNGRPFLYIEESLFRFAMQQGALCLMIPIPDPVFPDYDTILSCIDGLLLPGGDDVAPTAYQETALKEEWAGDPRRDAWEFPLLRHALKQGMPVLGICRGMQVINVCCGGSLWQDIPSQVTGAVQHKVQDSYQNNHHELKILPGGLFASWYPAEQTYRVNSIHHQAIRKLAPGLQIEAISPGDQIIEAVSLKTSDSSAFCVGVQWHPEFQTEKDEMLISSVPFLQAFLQAATSFRQSQKKQKGS